MTIQKKLSTITVLAMCAFGYLLAAPKAEAATLFLVSPETKLKIGQTTEVTVRVDSEGQSFNAAEATLKFPKDILEVKSVTYSSAASAFNFWLEDPQFSNQDGTAHFIGGTTSGLDGAAIPILKITFIAKGNGEATISITDAAVTAADGSGTNILSKIQPLHISVSPTILTPPAPTAPPSAAAIPETGAPAPSPIISLGPPPAPIQITRPPVAAPNLPTKPVLTVPAYPEQTTWHNITTNFLVHWNLPPDISEVATALNQNPTFTPSRSEGLFEEKVFPSVTDGVWYVHIRFKNNVGWGQTAHWRIALDTVPPAAFTIESSEGFKTGSPQPTLTFNSNDGLSGIRHYLIQVDTGDVVSQEGTSRTLPLQPPGKHTIVIKALDKAGNSTSQSVELEIIPIASPVIASLQQDLFVGEGNLAISGSALSNTAVLLKLKTEPGALIAESEIVTNADGNWQHVFERPLKRGHYFIEVTARDGRGALSFPLRSNIITVRERPLLAIGGIEITWGWVYTMSVLLLAGLFGWGYWWIKQWRNQARKRAVVGERDVANFFTAAKADLEKLSEALSEKAPSLTKIEEAKFLIQRLRDTTEKVEKYIEENIKEIPE